MLGNLLGIRSPCGGNGRMNYLTPFILFALGVLLGRAEDGTPAHLVEGRHQRLDR
jgi:hypothetical protein